MNLFGYIEMRALSWKQPYASLMLHEKVETRTWYTKYRGLVLICASKQPYSEMQMFGISGDIITQKILTMHLKEPTGMAIAVGNLVDCRKMNPNDFGKTFTKFHPDLWCHFYENVRPIEPFQWKGSQGWKKLSTDEIAKIKFL